MTPACRQPAGRGAALPIAAGLLLAVAAVRAQLPDAAAETVAVTIAELQEELTRGNYADVRERAEPALARLEEAGRGESLAAARLLDLLVVTTWRGGLAATAEAPKNAERAIAIKELHVGDDHPELAASLDNAGVLYFVRGEYDNALPHYQRALAILETAVVSDESARPALAKVYSHLGPLYQELGDYSTALAHYRMALGIFAATLGSRHRQVAMTQNNLATLMSKMGDFGSALRLYRQAGATLEATLGDDHPLIGSLMHNLGELNHRTGRYDAAQDLYTRSIALKERTLGLAHPSLALTLSNLSLLHSNRGQFEEAAAFARRALDIQTKTLGADHVDTAYSLISFGRARTEDVGAGGRIATLKRALDLRASTLGSDNPLLATPLHFLSDALLRDGDLQSAFEFALRAETITRAHLRLTARGAPERQALRYAAERLPSLHTVLQLAGEIHEAPHTVRAWDALLRSRAVVLDETAARHRLARTQTAEAVRRLLENYRSAAERLSNVLVRGPGGDLDRYRRRVTQLRNEKEAAERKLAAGSEAFRRGLTRQEIGLESVRAALPGDAALIAFARVGGDPRASISVPHYMAFVLEPSRGAPRVVTLGPAGDIERAIRYWRDQLTPEAGTAGIRAYRRAGEALRRVVWDPLRVDADGGQLVFVVPAGALHLVNFAALPLPDGRFLAEADLFIHYLSSERDLVAEGLRDGKPRLLAVGGPKINAVRPRRAVNAGFEPSATRDCGTAFTSALPELPGSLDEVRRIAAIWRATQVSPFDPPVVLVERSATETAFRRAARGKTVIHLATHGFFLANHCASIGDDIASPLRLSGLAFSRGDATGDRGSDGILTAEEVATLNFSDAEWVVLSGCDTGLGRIQTDEGVLGLRRAFRIAGAGTLVMSLWPAEDYWSRTFMTALYRARFEDAETTARAMRRAYRETLDRVRQREGVAHPLYWAPFTASGNWR